MILDDYLPGYNLAERDKTDPQIKGGLCLFERQVCLFRLLEILADRDEAAFGDQLGLTVYGLDDLLFLEDESLRHREIERVKKPLKHGYDFLAKRTDARLVEFGGTGCAAKIGAKARSAAVPTRPEPLDRPSNGGCRGVQMTVCHLGRHRALLQTNAAKVRPRRKAASD